VGKRAIPPLTGVRVRLRMLGEEDLPLTLAWRNADCNRVWFMTSEPIAWDQHIAWFERYRQRDDDFVWVIEQLDSPGPIGQVSIYNVDWEQRRAECGRLLIGDLAVRGRGLAQEAIRVCVGYATVVLGLTEVYCVILPDNFPSRAAFAAAGFLLSQESGQAVQMVFRGVP
jgi:diamine N-acetyltransferase